MKTIQLIGNFVKKEIDTKVFRMQLLENTKPYIFTENAIVRLIIENAGTNVVNKVVEIEDHTNGIVTFDLNEKLSDGNYNCEFVVYEGSEVMTFPTTGYQTFQINRNLERDLTGETVAPSEFEIMIERIETIESTLTTKSNIGHKHVKAEITDFAHGHTINDVEGLVDAFEDQQSLIDALDLETDEIQNAIADNVARLDLIQNSVTATKTLTDKINALPDNAGNFVEVAKVQGNTIQNLCPKLTSEVIVHKGTGVEFLEDGFIKITANGAYQSAFVKYLDTLKTDTVYTLVIEIAENTLEGTGTDLFYLHGQNGTESQFELSKIASHEKGLLKVLLGTTSDFTGSRFSLRTFVHNAVTSGYIVYRYMLLEGDWTNRTDIPDYFTGIQSVDSVQVKSVGKNLFNWKDGEISRYFATNCYEIKDNNLIMTNPDGGVYKYVGYNLQLKPNTTYTLSFDLSTNPSITNNYNVGAYVFANDFTKAISSFIAKSGKFTTLSDGLINIGFYASNANEYAGESTFSNIQIEENETATAYEPYQETTMQIPLAEPLRALPNGVCDYIADGKIVRNVGKYTFNEGKVPSLQSNITNEVCGLYVINTNNLGISVGGENTPKTGNMNLICDKLPVTSYAVDPNVENIFAISYNKNYNVFYFRLPFDMIGGVDTTSSSTNVRTWINSTQPTVYYPLATPIIEDLPIPNDAILQTYQNGHILLENTPIRPKVDVQYAIGLQGKISKLETEVAETNDLLDNVFTEVDVLDYWNGGNA